MKLNIIKNGDFQGTDPAIALVGGTPGAGQVNTFSGTLVTGWTLTANETNATSSDATQATVNIDATTPVSVSQAFGIALPAEVPGLNAVAVQAVNSGLFTSGAGSNITISQVIANAPLAAGGKTCLLDFWLAAQNFGEVRFSLVQTIGAQVITLISERVRVVPGWSEIRREFHAPDALAGTTGSFTFSVTVDSATDVSLGDARGVAVTGVYLGVPLAPNRFDSAQALAAAV